jgi:hypothetical protein
MEKTRDEGKEMKAAPPTAAQSLGALLKSARDIMCNTANQLQSLLYAA